MSRAQVAAIALATALNALDGFDVLSISFAAPGIAANWGIDRAALGIVLSLELVGMAAGSVLLGMVADRIGRRPTIFTCLAIMTTGMVASSAAPDVIFLAISRLFTGLGIGGMLAATNAVVAEFANARRRSMAVAIMAGGYPVGAVIGGSISSGLLASGFGWQSIFQFGAIWTALFVPLVWFLLPETLPFLLQSQRADRLERVNRLLGRMKHAPVAALAPLQPGRRKSSVGQLFAPGLVMSTLLLTASYFLHIMTFYFLMKWTPKIVADMGFTAAGAASVLVWANVGGATGSLVLSLLTQKLPLRTLTVSAMVGGTLSVIWFGQDHGGLIALSAVACLGGFFLNGATVGLYAMFAQTFPVGLRATGTGVVIGIGRGGAALGPIVAGFFFEGGMPTSLVAAILGCGSIAGALALLGLRRPSASEDGGSPDAVGSGARGERGGNDLGAAI